jgi:hypothetical protein
MSSSGSVELRGAGGDHLILRLLADDGLQAAAARGIYGCVRILCILEAGAFEIDDTLVGLVVESRPGRFGGLPDCEVVARA